jgi:hypothetical protein
VSADAKISVSEAKAIISESIERLKSHHTDVVSRLIEAHRREVAELAARVGGLEHAGRKTFADVWRGPFKEGERFPRGACATFQGGLWLATRDTSERPSGPDSGWRLILKRARGSDV